MDQDDWVSIDGRFVNDTAESVGNGYIYGLKVHPDGRIGTTLQFLLFDWCIRNRATPESVRLDAWVAADTMLDEQMTAGAALDLYGRDALRNLTFQVDRTD